ncbi:restriction endonuclease subunit S [Streptococcus suis]|nr:restriction endonuclease subunit S [Streptococcus suis]
MPNKDKNIPKRRFKAFENADAWELRRFSELAEIRRGLTYSPVNIRLEGIRVLRSSNIDEDTFTFGEDDVFVDKGVVKSPLVKEGDILITAANGSSRLVGKHTIIKDLPENSAIHGGFMLLASCRNPEFINSLMSSAWYTKFINLYVAGGNGAIGNLNKHDLDEQNVLVPSQKEQSAIGTFFSTLDQQITLHQRKLDKLKSVKQAYLSEMFPAEGERVPKRRFPGFTDDWELHPLREIGNTYTGLSGKTKDDFGHGDGRFVTYMNVFSNPISLPEMVEEVEFDESQNTVRYGDVLFTTSSETPEEVGMSSVWLENTENTYLNSFCFGFRPVKKVNPYYFAYLLRSSGMRRKISFLAQGISRYNISKAKMMELEISIPNENEQSAIGTFFSTLDQHITLHQRKSI